MPKVTYSDVFALSYMKPWNNIFLWLYRPVHKRPWTSAKRSLDFCLHKKEDGMQLASSQTIRTNIIFSRLYRRYGQYLWNVQNNYWGSAFNNYWGSDFNSWRQWHTLLLFRISRDISYINMHSEWKTSQGKMKKLLSIQKSRRRLSPMFCKTC